MASSGASRDGLVVRWGERTGRVLLRCGGARKGGKEGAGLLRAGERGEWHEEGPIELAPKHMGYEMRVL